jgi:hypothetical protein
LAAWFDSINKNEAARRKTTVELLSRGPLNGLNSQQRQNLADVVAGLIACEPSQDNASAIMQAAAETVSRRGGDSYLHAGAYATRDWGLETLLLLQVRRGASAARKAMARTALNQQLGQVLDQSLAANEPLEIVARKAALAVLLGHFAELRKAAHDQPDNLWQLCEVVIPDQRLESFTDPVDKNLLDDALTSMLCSYIETQANQWEPWVPQLQRLILTAPADRLQRFQTSATNCGNPALQESLTTWIDARK